MRFWKSIKNIFRKNYNNNGTLESEVSVKDENSIEQKIQSQIIYSPLNGDVVKLSEVNDPTFAQEMMGKGIAIKPYIGRVVSPTNGEIAAILNTKHAVALQSDNGVEILIHVGIDTVELGGQYFRSFVKQGDRVKVGDLLLEFDVDEIKREGYDVVTSIIITNTDNYSEINGTDKKEVKERDSLIEAIV